MKKSKRAVICRHCGTAVEVPERSPRPAMTAAEVREWMKKFYEDPENQKEYLKEAKKIQDFLAAAEKTYAEDGKAREKAEAGKGDK